MGNNKYESSIIVRKVLFLVLFMIGMVFMFNSTTSMIEFDGMTGSAIAADKRTVYFLVSLFGMIGYFLEVIFQRIKEIKQEKV